MTNGKPRVDFSKIRTRLEIPNLVEIQKVSYDRLLRQDVSPHQHGEVGLSAAFHSVFPIENYNKTAEITFEAYSLGQPKYEVLECVERGMSYAAPLKIRVKLYLYEKGDKTDRRTIKEVREQDVYLGELPLMTVNGTFILNGIERVVVSQLHRSPGATFIREKGKAPLGGRAQYTARVFPYRGSWLDFEYDSKDILHVRIDRKRKMPATILIKAFMTDEDRAHQDLSTEVLRLFYPFETISIKHGTCFLTLNPTVHAGMKAPRDIRRKASRQLLIRKGDRLTPTIIRQVKEMPVEQDTLIGRIVATTVTAAGTRNVLVERNTPLTADALTAVMAARVSTLVLLSTEHTSLSIRDTLAAEKVHSTHEAKVEIYKRLKPGETPTVEAAGRLFHNLFYDPKRYDLYPVGRLKLNKKLGLDLPLSVRTLTKQDVVEVIRYLVNLKMGRGEADDIDNLGNRRIRPVGELLENQFRVGLLRMERTVKERMNLLDLETCMPHDLINAKPVVASIKEFFGGSQLSQFMDQTNPLAEITHKRRLSALGPGGLTRERAGFEVRDVHPSHYGRICPIETPEGPNIGLIISLATYARVNEFGFIEAPYLTVHRGRVIYLERLAQDPAFSQHLRKESDRLVYQRTQQGKPETVIEYLSALEGDRYYIAQANTAVDAQGRIVSSSIQARYAGDFVTTSPDNVQYMDVSPKQIVSVASALIPFLENDDANRALMGANMQRQAVPLIQPEAPLVATGMEPIVARDSGYVALARRGGIVEYVDARRIVVSAEHFHQVKVGDTKRLRVSGLQAVRSDAPQVAQVLLRDGEIVVKGQNPGYAEVVVTIRQGGGQTDERRYNIQVVERMKDARALDIYSLLKFQRSNQNTCMHQKPVVKKDQRVEKGQVLADGPSTHAGELALGRNILVAFMPWGGYNFEDAILVSERLVFEDTFTSIHIEEFSIEARDVKQGKEEITRDIPNVTEEALRNLDEGGIIRMGAEVKPGEILVGKVVPKGETQLAPEEKLLRAIFGEKAADWKDSSLYVPPGIEGIVVDVKIFSPRGSNRPEKMRTLENQDITRLQRDHQDELHIIEEEKTKKVRQLFLGAVVGRDIVDPDTGEVVLKKKQRITEEALARLGDGMLRDIVLSDSAQQAKIAEVERFAKDQAEVLQTLYDERVGRLKSGDELPPGVLKVVTVYVAMKRKLSVGDKMAGRHGNKGVVSRILPVEDMPHLPDGTPVEIVLNPLGVPSRMNVGQILETHLGWACHALGVACTSPVFEGATEEEIKAMLGKAHLPVSGQTTLYDGLTGEPFDRPVTVGYMYMMKLHHLVDDKIHARSIGPYSLVTQQPLGGKAQFGGQRLGEMEVWALQAYGAASTLQEFLTVKSDDVPGRSRMYEAIVRGEHALEPGLPESFNVLIKELQALGLDVELLKTKGEG